MFQIGGTDVHVHKYLGPKLKDEGTADQPMYDVIKETNIQDLLFLENRDRKYEEEIYNIRGHYNIQNIDFNLSQFGLFIDNDTVFLHVHINDFFTTIGRKPLSGDVVELPHLRDDFALNDFDLSLPRFYVVEDVGRASEGFSATWYPHLYRLKLKKITDSQEFSDILSLPASDDSSFPLRDLLSTRNKELQINDAIIAQSEFDAALSGQELRHYYTLAIDPNTGQTILETVDSDTIDASYQSQRINGQSNVNASSANAVPLRDGYTGYLLGDGYPPNGYVFGHGLVFPDYPAADDFFLRLDFLPNRLFRFDGTKWRKVEDAVRMTMTQTNTRQTYKTKFINNTNFTYNDNVGTDYVRLQQGDTVIDTVLDYGLSALYVVFKMETIQREYVLADHAMIEPYTVNGIEKIRIVMPVTADGNQEVIPYNGLWKVAFYNYRESERQSLSTAIRPKADF